MIKDEIISIIYQLQQEAISTGNPLEHAEMSAIQQAISNYGSEVLKRAHLISSNEPCPMCMGACIWSGISEVSYFVSQEQVAAIRGWGKFMPANKIAEADDSGIIINGPIEDEKMLSFHREFWTTGSNSQFKHSIHLSTKEIS